MANVIDTLVTRFVADTKQYDAAAAGMIGITSKLGTVMSLAKNPITAVVAAVTAAASAYVLLNAAVVQFGMTAFREFGQYDALAKSLEAVEGSAGRAAEAMKVLRDVAKLPGIGLQESIRAFTSLRLNGMSGADAERTIRAAGNANALAGGGMDEFGRVMLAITQIMRNATGEEFNQLSEAGIPAHRIIKEAFGTSDMGELKKMGVTNADVLEALIAGLEKMPKAADSAKNSLENLQSVISLSLASIGSGMVAGGFTNVINGLTTALEDLEANGGFKIIGEEIANVVDSLNPFRDNMRSMTDALTEAGMGVAGLLGGLAELNNALRAWVTGDFKNMKWDIMQDVMNGAVQAAGRFYSTVMFNRLKRTIEDDPKLSGADKEADRNNRQATNHLAAIESNTRAMVDLQRHILGGGNIGAMAVTPIELSDIRRGGTGEEMVMSGIRKMMMELGVSSFGRRGMVR